MQEKYIIDGVEYTALPRNVMPEKLGLNIGDQLIAVNLGKSMDGKIFTYVGIPEEPYNDCIFVTLDEHERNEEWYPWRFARYSTLPSDITIIN